MSPRGKRKTIPEIEAAIAAGDLETAAWHYPNESIFVDWKDHGAIVDAFSKQLKGKLMGLEQTDKIVIEYGGRELEVDMEDPDQTEILMAIQQLIAPEHEFRRYKSSFGSDTMIFLLRPAAWWKRMDSEHPQAMEELFAPFTPESMGE